MIARLCFELEPITPLFSAGANQAGPPEVRPSSIRGALRFWFRAMMGGLLNGHWQDIRGLEADIFGDTEQASKIQICVTPKQLDIERPSGRPTNIRQGIVYLGFPFYNWAGGGQYNLLRAYLKPGSSFLVEIFLSDASVTVRNVILGALWLMIHFGGLGSRSRRGFGSLQAKSDPEGETLKLRPPADPRQLKSHFQEGLQWIESAFKDFASSRRITCSGTLFRTASRPLPEFSSFAKWKAALVTKDTWRNWEDVLHDLGLFMRCFRNNSNDPRDPTPDYSRVVTHYLPISRTTPGVGVRWLRSPATISSWDLKNDAFGLPIQFRSSSRSRQASPQGGPRYDISAIVGWRQQLASGAWEEHDRRASPLFVRPLRLGNQYAVALLVLESNFLSPGAVEWLKPGGRWPPHVPKPGPRPIPPADLTILYNFLNQARRTFNDLGELP